MKSKKIYRFLICCFLVSSICFISQETYADDNKTYSSIKTPYSLSENETLQKVNMDKINESYARQLESWNRQFPEYKPRPSKNSSKSKSSQLIPNKQNLSIGNTNKDIYKLMPKYLTNNFSFDMMAATVTNGNTVITRGNFRTTYDLSGMSWETEDLYSHKDLKYPTDPDFTNVNLSYSYYIYGDIPEMDSNSAPALTIETNTGDIFYVRLWNYVVDRPKDDWEDGSNSLFPLRRTSGNATGQQGAITIDFNNLYAGWQPYIKESKVITKPDGTKTYVEEWVKNPEWVKIPVTNIKRLMWAFVSKDYNTNLVKDYLPNSQKFMIKMTNWTVTGDSFLRSDPVAKSKHQVRLTDDYDDIYNLTPERVISDYVKLGYSGSVNMYVGASHFYDKRYSNGEMRLISDYPFNAAFEEWYQNYVQRLKENNFSLINSISMENVDAPNEWWQRAWDNTPATSGWTPTPHFLSFTNSEVQSFYKKYILGLAQISKENGLEPAIQLGEPWWWFMENKEGKPPTFYDKATKELYKKETGKDLYVFKSSTESFRGHEEMLNWLRDKNGEFTWLLRDALKEKYADAKFTVLFFTPSVIDKDRVPRMMSIVNFPKKHWRYPNLDFFMLEDYDYLIYDQMQKHSKSMIFVQSQLNYPPELIHYFAGFVLDQDHLGIWNNINQALNDGFNQKFNEVYIWAYAQIKRDGWAPPDFVHVNKPSGVYEKPFYLTLNSSADKMIYTLDGSTPTKANGKEYNNPISINKSTTLKVGVLKNGVITQIYDFFYDVGIKKFEYNTFNQLLSEQFAKNGKLYLTEYNYDELGNTTSIDRMVIDGSVKNFV